MKRLDAILRDIRIRQALPFIRPGDRLLDIGCFDQTLLNLVSGRVRSAMGVDPLAQDEARGNISIRRGTVPGELDLAAESFDCITMLAVLEHVPDAGAVARECARLLTPGGRVVITVPKPQVDHILALLTRLRLIDGMSLEEHHGYDIEQTTPVFEQAGFRLAKRRSFELGLNCLFVFERAARAEEAIRAEQVRSPETRREEPQHSNA